MTIYGLIFCGYSFFRSRVTGLDPVVCEGDEEPLEDDLLSLATFDSSIFYAFGSWSLDESVFAPDALELV